MNTVFALWTALYSAFLLWLRRGMQNIVHQDRQKPFSSVQQPISIIIAARNEMHNLPKLLASLALLNYPLDKYELILVNDHSEDGSKEFLDSQAVCPNLQVIHFYTESPGLVGKKATIQQGINAATNDVLAFTDADCIVPPHLAERDKPQYGCRHGLSIILFGAKKQTGRQPLQIEEF